MKRWLGLLALISVCTCGRTTSKTEIKSTQQASCFCDMHEVMRDPNGQCPPCDPCGATGANADSPDSYPLGGITGNGMVINPSGFGCTPPPPPPCQMCVAYDTCTPPDWDYHCRNAVRGAGYQNCNDSQTPPACWVCTQAGRPARSRAASLVFKAQPESRRNSPEREHPSGATYQRV